MNQGQSSNKRIAKNAIFLYMRTLFVMAVSLYTSRVVLEVLGVNDYGIYNVVGGVVAMLGFLNSAMVQSTQRYLNFSQGKMDYDYQVKVFSTSMVIHFSIALVVFLMLESIGLWYVNNKVVLPEDRIMAANVVFQVSIFIFITKIISVPYTASVIANEHMHIYAFVSIIDVCLQLFIVFALRIFNYDKLILFAYFQASVAVINFLLYYIYCKLKFRECIYRKVRDLSLYKEMFHFACWSFLGGFGFIARLQGVNLVINLFCGPAVNAARAVAFQANSAIQTFVTSFLHAINPQITKRYASGDIDSMMLLVRTGSKYTFLSLLICCTPIIIRSEYVLNLWLGKAPVYSSEFLVLALVMSLITSMGGPLNTAMQATGNIKIFQIVVTIIMCLDIPCSYILLQMGVFPYLVTIISIVTATLCLVAKLLILRKLIPYNISYFFINIVLKNFTMAAIMIYLFLEIDNHLPSNFIGLIFLCLLTIFLYSIVIYIFCLEQWEKRVIHTQIKRIILRYF